MQKEERPGYRFEGWYVDPERTKRLNPGGRLPQSVQLYPKWSLEVYPIYYDLEEGVNSSRNPHTLTVESGIIKLYPAYARGKQFAGWYLDGKKVSFIEEGITHPITLKGYFQDPVPIHFETYQGSKAADVLTDENGRIEKWPTPLRPGYQIAGWSMDPMDRQPVELDHTFLKETTLYARWALQPFTITLDADGGLLPSGRQKLEYTIETPSFLLEHPVREGYRFAGWKDDRNNAHRIVRKGSIGDRHLKAEWVDDTYIHYPVHFDRTDSDIPDTEPTDK